MKKKKGAASKSKVDSKFASKGLDFKVAFKYPFNRAKGMWNILWVLFPIFGWLALGGYGVRIVQEFNKGKFKQLPTFKFKSDMKLGFFMFLKSLPFAIAYGIFAALLNIPGPVVGGIVRVLLEFFVIPILTINFLIKETIGAYFEFEIVGVVFRNLGDYIITILKSILLAIIFIVMILVLVGLPAGAFTKSIYLTDFYRRRVK